MQENSVGIIGCGWLGMNLAKSLLSEGVKVLGSTTQASRLNQLKNANIESYLLKITPEGAQGTIDPFLKCSTLVIGIPPKLRAEESSPYLSKIDRLVEMLKSYSGQLVFLSSTGIYNDQQGLCREDLPVQSPLKRVQNLALAEDKIRTHVPSSVVFRLGGLLGSDRHPIYRLAGKLLLNPDSKINCIHISDVIAAIQLCRHLRLAGETYNLVSPHHPKKGVYYPKIAKLMNLDPPKFGEQVEKIRIVDHSKFCEQTGFIYSVQDLYQLGIAPK